MSGRQTTRGEKEQAACGVRGRYGPVWRGQQQDHAAKEVGPGRWWVFNTTAKHLTFISWVALRKGCIDGQLAKREALSMPWLSAMLTPFC